MGFMRGETPVRRTMRYMLSGKIVFKDKVKILSINYNTAKEGTEAHQGLKDFVFWELPRLQYKNPEVQMVLFKNVTPSPFLRFWLDDGRDVIFDVFGQSKEEIIHRITRVLGKSDEQLKLEEMQREKRDTSANFGRHYPKFCICEVPGQVPCTGLVAIPKPMRGKYKVLALQGNDN